jgi:hypothetical protein
MWMKATCIPAERKINGNGAGPTIYFNAFYLVVTAQNAQRSLSESCASFWQIIEKMATGYAAQQQLRARKLQTKQTKQCYRI